MPYYRRRYKRSYRPRYRRGGRNYLARNKNAITKAYSGSNARGTPVNANGKRVVTKWNAAAKLNGNLFGFGKFKVGGGISQKILSSNAEKKYHSYTSSGTLYGGGAFNYWCLNNIAAGTASNQRIGRSIRIANIQVRVAIERSASASQDVKYRWILGIDKTCRTQALPAVDSIFTDDSDWLSYRIHPSEAGTSYVDTGRYTLLRDKVFTISNTSSSLTRYIDLNIPTDICTKYMDTDNGVDAIQQNMIFLGIIDHEPAYASGVTISYRVTYYDD